MTICKLDLLNVRSLRVRIYLPESRRLNRAAARSLRAPQRAPLSSSIGTPVAEGP